MSIMGTGESFILLFLGHGSGCVVPLCVSAYFPLDRKDPEKGGNSSQLVPDPVYVLQCGDVLHGTGAVRKTVRGSDAPQCRGDMAG